MLFGLSTETLVALSVGAVVLAIFFIARGSSSSSSSSSSSASDSSSSSSSSSAAGAGAEGEAKSSRARSEYIEGVVAKASDLKEGELKEVELGEGVVLIGKHNEKIFACGAKCTHQGAPLKNGAFVDGRIRCQWHGACFDAATGDIEDYPGIDPLPHFDTKIDANGDVVVRADKKYLKPGGHKRVLEPVGKNTSVDKRVFVIVGGGVAALTAAETLRRENFKGRILMYSREAHLPYDRTKLSKAFSVSAASIVLRQEAWFREMDIEIQLSTEVKFVDTQQKQVTLSTGAQQRYDVVLLAMGAVPRMMKCPGNELAGIYPLRTPEDAAHLSAIPDGKHIVIVGTSFVGMEVAAVIAKKAASVTAIGMESVPFERVLGKQVGAALQKLHEGNGVQFRLLRTVKEFKGSNGKVAAVVLDNGEELKADYCIVGAGCIPSSECVVASPPQVKLAGDGSIIVDATLRAGIDVFVAGDLARFPYWQMHDELIRVEHFAYSMYTGALAARNMLGGSEPVRSIPFFWSSVFGKNIRYCGHALSYDQVLVDGDVDALKFVAYYCKGDKVLAACSSGRDPIVSKVAELMHSGKMLTPAQLIAAKFQF